MGDYIVIDVVKVKDNPEAFMKHAFGQKVEEIEFDYSEIVKESLALLKDVEDRITLCLKATNKDKEKGMPPGLDWKSEALGYKTSLECLKRTREKFNLVRNLNLKRGKN